MEEYLAYIESNPIEGFEDWIGSLSPDPLKGMNSACWSWINAWGSGGGSYETEMRAKSAIEECTDESPRSIADAVYHAIVDCTESPMSASCITQLMVEESASELGIK